MREPITPQYVEQLVNFGAGSTKEWTYEVAGVDMRSMQVRGTAAIFNILQKEKIALLADEVGMGKTIQALSVCAALWKEKPHAKIMIIAPREEVVRNWISEYASFINKHYKVKDNVVKSQAGGEPVNKLIYCENVYSWVYHLTKSWATFFIGKTTSLSSIAAQKDVKGHLSSLGIKRSPTISADDDDATEKICRVLRRHIDETNSSVDLLIIDEAHYYRRADGDSLRVLAAKMLFSEGKKFAKHVLLLTATPNHSSSEDIRHITSYFTNKFSGWKGSDILQEICVRRLRRLSNHGLTKHQYRHEIAVPAKLEEDPLGELFFGLYHASLVRQMTKNGNGKVRSGERERLRSYLEATEFLPSSQDDLAATEGGDLRKATGKDFPSGEDRNILLTLAKQYHNIFKRSPNHPKYEAMLSDIKQSGKSKSLVFVRRISSVYEINRRVVHEHEALLWAKMRVLPELQVFNSAPSRADFKLALDKVVAGKVVEEEDVLPELEAVNSPDPVRNYRIKQNDILDYFIPKKDDSNNQPALTPASNFRKRFDHSSASAFNLFFSPGPHYDYRRYDVLPVYKYDSGSKKVPNYYESALIYRIEQNSEWEKVSRHEYQRRIRSNEEPSLEDQLETFFTMFWQNVGQENEAWRLYSAMNVSEKEALCNYLEKGLLYGSDFIVDLFILFWQGRGQEEEKDAAGNYRKFCSAARSLVERPDIQALVSDAIINFRTIYGKVYDIHQAEKLFNFSWSDFSYQIAYPYNADNKNASVLKTFNTPFYPRYLVATSVLQEGMNLQFYCDTVHHYGSAWTFGDNEQRIGRIDRMFSLVERRLNSGDTATLDIKYPYLKDTVDESNLAWFLKKKHTEELLLDEGRSADEFVKKTEEDVKDEWAKYLRVPGKRAVIEPYKYEHDRFAQIKHKDFKPAVENLSTFRDRVMACLAELKDPEVQISPLVGENGYGFVADPILKRVKTRRQPVIVEFHLDDFGSAIEKSPIYLLSMRTPLQSARRYKEVERVFNEIHCPANVKVCFDKAQRAGSYWGIYVRADLPVMLNKADNLSSNEVKACFESLVSYADNLERLISDHDLTKKDLQLSEDTLPIQTAVALAADVRTSIRPGWELLQQHFVKKVKLKMPQKLSIKDCWILNHSYPYATFMNEAQNALNVFLYSNHGLALEFSFLESFSQELAEKVEWEGV